MPKALIYITLTILSLLTLPPAIIARLRAMPSDKPRVHIIQDMDNMSRFGAQQEGPFADTRAMRKPVSGTIARGEYIADEHTRLGHLGNEWASTLPPQYTVDRALLERGADRYAIYCALCHGHAGYGDGPVHQRANMLLSNPSIANNTTWVQPRNIHEEEARVQPVGQIFHTITYGIRNMSGYKAQVPLDDRWAIAAYVKALQRSQNAEAGDVSPSELERLEVVDLRVQEDS